MSSIIEALRPLVEADPLPKGPRVFGWRVPYVNYIEARVWHRLARLAQEEARG